MNTVETPSVVGRAASWESNKPTLKPVELLPAELKVRLKLTVMDSLGPKVCWVPFEVKYARACLPLEIDRF